MNYEADYAYNGREALEKLELNQQGFSYILN